MIDNCKDILYIVLIMVIHSRPLKRISSLQFPKIKSKKTKSKIGFYFKRQIQ